MKKSISALVCPHCGHVEENQQLSTEGLWLAMAKQPCRQCPKCEEWYVPGGRVRESDNRDLVGCVEGKDCCNHEIVPIRSALSLHTNRHRNVGGSKWGWIEGCDRNICWSNNKPFDYKAAREYVEAYNQKLGSAHTE